MFPCVEDSSGFSVIYNRPSFLQAEPKQLDAAWTLEFEKWQPDAPSYASVDTELRMRLTTLFFYCNRPTLGALMGLGGDLSAAAAAPPGPLPAAGAQSEEAPAAEPEEDDEESEALASDDSSGTPPAPIHSTWPAVWVRPIKPLQTPATFCGLVMALRYRIARELRYMRAEYKQKVKGLQDPGCLVQSVVATWC